MLEQYRVASQGWIEDPHVEETLNGQQHYRNA
jgi:hypothetical protein